MVQRCYWCPQNDVALPDVIQYVLLIEHTLWSEPKHTVGEVKNSLDDSKTGSSRMPRNRVYKKLDIHIREVERGRVYHENNDKAEIALMHAHASDSAKLQCIIV